MSENKDQCDCGCGTKLIFACSGAADVGEVADLAARKMTREGVGKMSCIAGVGGQVGGLIKMTEAATDVLAIDGCPAECVKHCLLEAGFEEFHHMQLAEMGLIKGETEVNEATIDRVVIAGAEKLGTR